MKALDRRNGVAREHGKPRERALILALRHVVGSSDHRLTNVTFSENRAGRPANNGWPAAPDPKRPYENRTAVVEGRRSGFPLTSIP